MKKFYGKTAIFREKVYSKFNNLLELGSKIMRNKSYNYEKNVVQIFKKKINNLRE